MGREYIYERNQRYEALIRNNERLPAVAYTCWTIVLVTVSLALIALFGLNQVVGI